MRRRKNPIDIDLYEFNEKAITIRSEIGRFDFSKEHGRCLFIFNKKKKEDINLGNQFTDDDLIPKISKGIIDFGAVRKKICVGVKDGIYGSLRVIEEQVELSDTEKEILQNILYSIETKNINTIKILERPKSFSLKPIMPEQTRFVLDTNTQLQDAYKDETLIDIMRKLSKSLVPMFIVFMIVVLVVIVVLIVQGRNLIPPAVPAPLPAG